VNGAHRTLESKSEWITAQLSKAIATVKKVLRQTAEVSTILLPTSQAVDELCKEFSDLKADCATLLADAREVLALHDIHVGWVLMIDQIYRTGNYITLLQGFTDAGTFLSRHKTFMDDLMEGLSVGGLSHYSELYTQFYPLINALYIEVSTAIQAAELARTHSSDNTSSPTKCQSHDLQVTRDEIMNLMLQPEITFDDVVKACALQPDELQQLLLELEAEGQLSIYFRSGKEKHL
jgi:hypothetical protein